MDSSIIKNRLMQDTKTLFHFSFLDASFIEEMLPLMNVLHTTPPPQLKARCLEAFTQESYKCLGIFQENRLVGLCGLWFSTRHYSGRSLELDHVIIHPDLQGHGAGQAMLDFIKTYAQENDIEAIELNCYVQNFSGIRFWIKEGFDAIGYHYRLNVSK